MRFGGHESFAVREGWLSRGLELLCESPDLLVHEYAEDYLGVGRNMAKAIRHWLHATGLSQGSGVGIDAIAPTPLGQLVRKRDPHLLDLGTWWILHINLVTQPHTAYSWNWFFNHWSNPRFERGPCIEGLKRYAAANLARTPSARTLERDIATLLQSYAKPVPPRRDDPEDSGDSPFQDLDLLAYFAGSGAYQINFGAKRISPAVFGYAISRANLGDGRSDLSLNEIERGPSAPGRLFLLRGDELYDLLIAYDEADPKWFVLRSQAGERGVRVVQNCSPTEWASLHYATAVDIQHA